MFCVVEVERAAEVRCGRAQMAGEDDHSLLVFSG